jgi:hypothetical protein
MPKMIGDVEIYWNRVYTNPVTNAKTRGFPKPFKLDLDIEESDDQSKIKVSSKNMSMTWYVQAIGSDDEVRNLEVGASNTVYTSERTWYYKAATAKDRFKMVDSMRGPAWDGMSEDDPPWYGEPVRFKKLKAGRLGEYGAGFDEGDWGAAVRFGDAPYTGPFEKNADMGKLAIDGKPLFLVNGFDTFKVWLVARDRSENQFHVLDGLPWYVRYGVSVDDEGKRRFSPTAGTYINSFGPGFLDKAKLDGLGSEDKLTVRKVKGYSRTEVVNILGYTKELADIFP